LAEERRIMEEIDKESANRPGGKRPDGFGSQSDDTV